MGALDGIFKTCQKKNQGKNLQVKLCGYMSKIPNLACVILCSKSMQENLRAYIAVFPRVFPRHLFLLSNAIFLLCKN